MSEHRSLEASDYPEMDEETAGAVDALGSARTVGELAKLMQAAMRAEWRSMSSRATINADKLDSIQRQVRIAFVLLGLLLVTIGVVEIHTSNQHHADTQANISRNKLTEQRDLRRVQLAEYHGRIESAILGCRRTDQRHRAAIKLLNKDAPGNAPGKSQAEALIQALTPFQADCVTYAHLEIKAPGVSNH